MISRVANSCYWLSRYVERAENTARLLGVHRTFLLDVNLPELERWLPVITVAGEEERFQQLFSDSSVDDGELVQRYMTWDDRNPASIYSSVQMARENARTVREVISLEIWETINAMWHWLTGEAGRASYDMDADAFYQHIKGLAAEYLGYSTSTMLYEQPLDFMRMGLMIERAGQTARIMDIKDHLLGSSGSIESHVEAVHWLALLRSCSGTEAFFKRSKSAPSGTEVMNFLLKDEIFPRSVVYCLERLRYFLVRVRLGREKGVGIGAAEMTEQLLRELRAQSTDEVIEEGIHEELTRVVDSLAEISQAIDEEFFHPRLPPAMAGARSH